MRRDRRLENDHRIVIGREEIFTGVTVMSSIVSSCPTCGQALTPGLGGYCPQCSPEFHPAPMAPPPQTGAKWLDLLWAFIVWGVSGGFLLLLEYSFRLALLATGRRIPDVQLTQGAVILSLALTFI